MNSAEPNPVLRRNRPSRSGCNRPRSCAGPLRPLAANGMSMVIQNPRTTYLISLLCICLAGCGPSEPSVRVVGNLSSNDLVQFKRVVFKEMINRRGSKTSIKTIAVTTNNLYELERRIIPVLAAHATNDTAKARLHEIENRVLSAPGQSNLAVEVWYDDANARRGEAGYALENGSNGWKVFVELGR